MPANRRRRSAGSRRSLFAALYHLGGWYLARAVHQLALVGSLLIAAATCRRDATSPFSVLLAMTVAFVVMLPNADFRPQSFGLLGFATLLALARGRLPFAVNLLGRINDPGHLAKYASLGRAGYGRDGRIGRSRISRPQERSAGPLGAGRPGSACHGVAVRHSVRQPHPSDVSRVNLRISRDVLRNAEWLPPWDPAVAFDAVSIYWLVLLGSVIAVIWFWNRLSLQRPGTVLRDDNLVALCDAVHHFLGGGLGAVVGRVGGTTHSTRDVRLGARPRGSGGTGGFGRGRYWQREWRSRPVFNRRGPGLSSVPRFTLEGVRALRAELPGAARIYNHYGWAGPLLLEGPPEWRVAVDGRLYFFSDPAEWQSIEDARAGRIALDELERRHRPDAFFLYPGGNRALVEALSSCPRWRACFSGPTCVAFVRSRPGPAP